MPSFREIIERKRKREAKAKAILLATIRAAGGKVDRRTILYKVFWTAHLHHMSVHGCRLSDWPVVHLPRGPAPNDGRELLKALEHDGLIEQGETLVGGRTARTAKILDSDGCDEILKSHLSREEMDSIEEMTRAFDGVTSTAASNWSHDQSRAWRETKDGEEMSVYLDLIEDDEDFASLKKSIEAGRDLADRIFNPNN